MTFLRKNHRLRVDQYTGIRAYFVTIVTENKKHVFVSEQTVLAHLAVLSRAAENFGFDIPAYCFMPDHVHFLAQGCQASSDLIGLVKHYKQITGYRYRKETQNRLWQKSFNDHILRSHEDIRDAVTYILENPVRKKIVPQPADYPFSGSMTCGDNLFK